MTAMGFFEKGSRNVWVIRQRSPVNIPLYLPLRVIGCVDLAVIPNAPYDTEEHFANNVVTIVNSFVSIQSDISDVLYIPPSAAPPRVPLSLRRVPLTR